MAGRKKFDQYTNRDYAADVRFVFTYAKLPEQPSTREMFNALRLVTWEQPMLYFRTRSLPNKSYLAMAVVDALIEDLEKGRNAAEVESAIRGQVQQAHKEAFLEINDIGELCAEVPGIVETVVAKQYQARYDRAVKRIKKFAKQPKKKKYPRPPLEKRLEQGSLFDNPPAHDSESDHLGPDGRKR